MQLAIDDGDTEPRYLIAAVEALREAPGATGGRVE